MALIIEYEYQGYTFDETPKGGGHSIYVRIRNDPSWNSPAYTKKVHKGSNDENLDWNMLWYKKQGSYGYSTKNVKTRNTFKDDPLKRFETYFPSEPNNKKLLVLVYVTKSGKKSYITRNDLKLENNGDIDISSFKTIDEKQLLDKLYEENFTQNKALTIKIDNKVRYHKVEVSNDPVSGTEEFHKYIHKPNTDDGSINHLVLDCGSKCQFNHFKGSDHKDSLEELAVCFHKGDYNNRVPLLIEFKPKHGQFGTHGNKVLQLESINKNSDDNPTKWTKIYKYVTSLNGDVSDIIEEIYNNKLKAEINEILAIDDNSTVIKAVSGSVGTISAIGTGVGGFLIYKNSALVMSFLKSLF